MRGLNAYYNSKYIVPDLTMTVLIGQENKQLLEILLGNGVSTFCFITAFNPYSMRLEDEENEKRNQELARKLKKYPHYEGYGTDQEELWQPEMSFLVLGITKEDAIELGKKYEQNALVFGEIESDRVIPQLLLISQDAS
jgi:Protein of unknown function (DUF3293)